MRIRKMVIDDYDEVYKLWMSCSGMGLNNLDDSKEGISKFLVREDLVYRNKAIVDIVRIDT